MTDRGIYLGNGLQQVDDKGRVALPSSLRATLEQNCPAEPGSKGARQFVMSVHERAPCIVAYDRRRAEERVRRAQEAALALPEDRALDADNRLRMVSGGGDYTSYDSSGRFILSGFPRFEANIGKLAMFYGVGEEIEIWDPATMLDYDGVAPVMKKLCRYLLKEKGIEL